MKFKSLALLVFLIGCEPYPGKEPKPKVIVNMDRCVLECVTSYLSSKEKIDGQVVEAYTQLCKNSLVGRTCCLNHLHLGDYSIPCDKYN